MEVRSLTDEHLKTLRAHHLLCRRRSKELGLQSHASHIRQQVRQLPRAQYIPSTKNVDVNPILLSTIGDASEQEARKADRPSLYIIRVGEAADEGTEDGDEGHGESTTGRLGVGAVPDEVEEVLSEGRGQRMNEPSACDAAHVVDVVELLGVCRLQTKLLHVSAGLSSDLRECCLGGQSLGGDGEGVEKRLMSIDVVACEHLSEKEELSSMLFGKPTSYNSQSKDPLLETPRRQLHRAQSRRIHRARHSGCCSKTSQIMKTSRRLQ